MPADAANPATVPPSSTSPAPASSGNVSSEPVKGAGAFEAAFLVSKEAEAKAEDIAAALAAISSPESSLGRMPLQLDVMVPVPRFRVEDLLALEKGRVLETAWIDGDDLPVRGGGIQLVWSEFEVVEQKLAVRVTRLV